MISAPSVFETFENFMSGNVEAVFRAFVHGTHTRKWMISADFVLSGDERVNDTFAFTVFRYDKDDFGEVMSEARRAIPRDLKKVKSVGPNALAYLASRERFHFCFMPDRGRHAGDTVEDARTVIDDTIESINGWSHQSDRDAYLTAFAALRQEAKGRRFPVGLLNDVVLLAALASCIAFYIAKHSDPEFITWFIDRDKMTTAFKGIVTWAMTANFTSLCEQNGIDRRRVTLGNAVETEATNGREGWFDALVRPADYIAGAMARWDLRENVLRSGSDKFVQMADSVIGENPHIAVTYLHFGIFGGRSFTVRAYKKERTNLLAYMPTRDQWVGYLASRATRDWMRKRPTIRSVTMRYTGYTPIRMRLPFSGGEQSKHRINGHACTDTV